MTSTPPSRARRNAQLSVLAVASVLALTACSSKAPPAAATAPKPALTVEVIQPHTTEMATSLPASGGVYAWQEASVGSEVSGLRVSDVSVNVGDHVKKGQVLVRLLDDTVRADVAQQEAAVADAQATLAQAQANATRARTLEASKAVSAQDLLAAQTAEASAVARLKSAQAALASQRLRLAKTQIVAPDDGTVSSRSVAVGQVTGTGSELFKFIRQDRLEWRAELSAQAILTAKPGQTAQLTLADGTKLEGKVRQLAPTLDTASRSGVAYVDLPAGSKAKPGMFVSGRLLTGAAPAKTVPGAALVVRDGVTYVMSVDATNKVHPLKVTTGQRERGEVELVTGLPSESVKVVAQGAAFLNEGDVVQVVSAKGGAQ
jgi:RND family efflux transporter MFP subunit